MEPAFDERDVTSILNGVFYMNGCLADIAKDIHSIRLLLEDGDDEEEEDEDDGGDAPLG